MNPSILSVTRQALAILDSDIAIHTAALEALELRETSAAMVKATLTLDSSDQHFIDALRAGLELELIAQQQKALIPQLQNKHEERGLCLRRIQRAEAQAQEIRVRLGMLRNGHEYDPGDLYPGKPTTYLGWLKVLAEIDELDDTDLIGVNHVYTREEVFAPPA